MKVQGRTNRRLNKLAARKASLILWCSEWVFRKMRITSRQKLAPAAANLFKTTSHSCRYHGHFDRQEGVLDGSHAYLIRRELKSERAANGHRIAVNDNRVSFAVADPVCENVPRVP